MKIQFNKAVVKSGLRSNNDSQPVLTVTPSLNGFRLNDAAMKLMELEEGNRIVLFDAFGQDGVNNNNERFFIAKAEYAVDGVQQGAILGKKLNGFSYSSIYSSILANDIEVGVISTGELVDKGLLIQRENKSGAVVYSAIKTMKLSVVPYQEGEEVEIADGVERKLFQLVLLREDVYTPRVLDTDDSSDTVDKTEMPIED